MVERKSRLLFITALCLLFMSLPVRAFAQTSWIHDAAQVTVTGETIQFAKGVSSSVLAPESRTNYSIMGTFKFTHDCYVNSYTAGIVLASKDSAPKSIAEGNILVLSIGAHSRQMTVRSYKNGTETKKWYNYAYLRSDSSYDFGQLWEWPEYNNKSGNKWYRNMMVLGLPIMVNVAEFADSELEDSPYTTFDESVRHKRVVAYYKYNNEWIKVFDTYIDDPDFLGSAYSGFFSHSGDVSVSGTKFSDLPKDKVNTRYLEGHPSFNGSENPSYWYPGPSPSGGDYSFVIVPDIQYLPAEYPSFLNSVFSWIAENAAKLNIKAVLSMGDMVHDCKPYQFEEIKNVYSLLDGIVPYTVLLGNHDFPSTANRDTSLFNLYFPKSYHSGLPGFGGAFDDTMDNTYLKIDAFGIGYIIFSLEYGPRDEVLDWVCEVTEEHPDYNVIITTHGYLSADGRLLDGAIAGSPSLAGYRNLEGNTINDGTDIWEKVASKYPNVSMVLCGHIVSETIIMRADQGENGNKVIQMLINGQNVNKGGEGLLAIFKFSDYGRKVEIDYYSPYRKEYYRRENQITINPDVVYGDDFDFDEYDRLVEEYRASLPAEEEPEPEPEPSPSQSPQPASPGEEGSGGCGGCNSAASGLPAAVMIFIAISAAKRVFNPN